MSHHSSWPPVLRVDSAESIVSTQDDDDVDMDVDIETHLNLPSNNTLRSTKPFKELFDASCQTNPSKRLKPSDSRNDTHFKKDGYLLAKSKSLRHFELTQSSLFVAIELLYREIEKLQTQMSEIHESIKELTSLHSPLKSSIDSFSDQLQLLSKNPTSSPTPLHPSSTRHPNDSHRKSQVFLRNLSLSVDDSLTLKDICTKIDSPCPIKHFRLKGTGGIRPLILTFSSEQDASSFLRLLSKSKRDGLLPSSMSPLIARPNFTIEEEKIYHSAWADACAKNDEAGKMLFVVRNFKVVLLKTPREWIQKVRPNH